MQRYTLILRNGISSIGDNTWAIPTALSGPQAFKNLAGLLVLSAPVNNQGHDLTLVSQKTLRFDSVIAGAGAVVKAGSGKLVLTASNSYTGPTIVREGVLELTNPDALANTALIDVQLQGVLDASELATPLTVGPNQTLKGSGMVVGPLTVHGTLTSGSDSIGGYLIVSNRLALEGKTILQLGPSAFERNNGALRIAGEVEIGGALIVTNGAFGRLNDTFKLIDATRFTGSFSRFELPSLSAGLVWDTSRLAVDGTIRVSLPPPELHLVASNPRTLILRFGTSSGVTYVVESTTNLRIPSGWDLEITRVAAGSSINLVFQVDSSEPQRFFRARSQ